MNAAPVTPRPAGRKRTGHSAQRLFFPAAALLAALGPWLLLAGPATVDAPTHARSMLFGYVGALIAGYLGGKVPAAPLAILFGLWLAGRCAELFYPQPLLVQLLYAGFGLNLAALVVPRFSAAKKWRNRLIIPLLAAITCFPLLLWAAGAVGMDQQSALHYLVLMIALLMFFMGGRFITPLLARACAERGEKLPHRVQPVLEGTVMVSLLCACALGAVGADGSWTALPVGLAGVLALVRLARWRLFFPGPRHTDLGALGTGYLWLGLGLLALSLSLAGMLPLTASLHVITVGALGTLSCTVMLKSAQGAGEARAAVYYPVIALLSAACIARFGASQFPALRTTLLVTTGSLWSLNFLLVACHLASANRMDNAGRRTASRQVRSTRLSRRGGGAAQRLPLPGGLPRHGDTRATR